MSVWQGTQRCRRCDIPITSVGGICGHCGQPLRDPEDREGAIAIAIGAVYLNAELGYSPRDPDEESRRPKRRLPPVSRIYGRST